jgi:hypothetical protein
VNIQAIVETLRARGVSDTDILDAITAGQVAPISTVTPDERAARRAARNARYYDTKRLKASEQDVSDACKTGEKEGPPHPLKKITNLPPSVPSEPQTPRGSRSSGSRLPEEFDLTPELIARGGEHGLTEAQCQECLDEMREWAWGNSNRPVARKADWSLTLQGWFRRKAKDLARAGPRTVTPFPRRNGWDDIFAKTKAAT